MAEEDSPFVKVMKSMAPPDKALNEYRLLGKSGIRVSSLCLGGMSFGSAHKAMVGEVTKEDSFKLMDEFVALGGNFIDTANGYNAGQSEEYIGAWMKARKNRDAMVVATKYSFFVTGTAANEMGNHVKSLRSSVAGSLKRLQVEYLDVLYVHWWDWSTDVKEVMRTLNNMVVSGKVLALGVSDTPAWLVAQANTIAQHHGWAEFVVYQGKYNIGTRDLERDILPMTRKFKMAVCIWSAIGGGLYSGKYKRDSKAEDTVRPGVKPTDKDYDIIEELEKIAGELKATTAQIAIAWTRSNPRYNIIPLIGVRKSSHLSGCAPAARITLSKEQLARLNKLAKFDVGFPHDFTGGSSVSTMPLIFPGGKIKAVFD